MPEPSASGLFLQEVRGLIEFRVEANLGKGFDFVSHFVSSIRFSMTAVSERVHCHALGYCKPRVIAH